MKKFIKLLSAILSVAIMATGLTACGPVGPDDNIDIDTDKVQIYVSHYNGGVGKAWLDKIITDFETQYADYDGVEGKVGVQIVPNNHKTQGDSLAADLLNEKDEVFFTDGSAYYEMVSTGVVLDISTVLTDTNADGKTIESKLNEQQKSYYKVNGAYYALPHYEIFGGLTYNRGLFDSEQFFFAKGGAPSEYCDYIQQNNTDHAPIENKFTSYTDCEFTNLDGELSAGPDGKYGTSDDGLPATYEEFFVLCDRMVEYSTNPFTWSGQVGKAYMGYLLGALLADCDGQEMMELSYNFDNGIADKLIQSIDNNGNITWEYNVPINKNTGYKIFRTEGMYRALQFLDRMTSNSSYYSSKLTEGQAHSHISAQREFVLSQFNPDKWNNGKYIGMLVEGAYWENEARDMGIFDDLSESNKTAADVSYANMPMPKVDESRIGEKATVSEGQGNLTFVRKNIDEEKVDIIKEFVKFCYTDAKLQEFTAITGVTRGLNYDLSNVSGVGLTDYAKSIIDLKSNSNIAYGVSGSEVYIAHQSYFGHRFRSQFGPYCLDEIMKSNVSARDIFNSILEHRSQTNWNSEMGI